MNPIVAVMDAWERWRKPAPKFPNSFQMNWYMFRIQEFYESPEFQGKHFTTTAYMHWYAANEHKRKKKTPNAGGFDYLTRVLGLNVPGISFTAFFSLFPDVRPEEKVIADLVKKELGIESLYEEVFYVLGHYPTIKEDDALSHELMHARFYLDGEYRDEVTKLVHLHYSPALERALLKRGYCKEVLIDEMAAFSLDGHAKWFPWWRRDKEARQLQAALREKFPQPHRKGGSRR